MNYIDKDTKIKFWVDYLFKYKYIFNLIIDTVDQTNVGSLTKNDPEICWIEWRFI